MIVAGDMQLKGQSATSTHGTPTFPLWADQTHTGWVKAKHPGPEQHEAPLTPYSGGSVRTTLLPVLGAPITIYRR